MRLQSHSREGFQQAVSTPSPGLRAFVRRLSTTTEANLQRRPKAGFTAGRRPGSVGREAMCRGRSQAIARDDRRQLIPVPPIDLEASNRHLKSVAMGAETA